MVSVSDSSIKDVCEETLPTNGLRCARPASIRITRFGEPFSVCAECAMRDYLHHLRNSARTRDQMTKLKQATSVGGLVIAGLEICTPGSSVGLPDLLRQRPSDPPKALLPRERLKIIRGGKG
jgi:hypothetical protein